MISIEMYSEMGMMLWNAMRHEADEGVDDVRVAHLRVGLEDGSALARPQVNGTVRNGGDGALRNEYDRVDDHVEVGLALDLESLGRHVAAVEQDLCVRPHKATRPMVHAIVHPEGLGEIAAFHELPRPFW